MRGEIRVRSIILCVFVLMILCSNTIIGSKTETTILLTCIISLIFCKFAIKEFDLKGKRAFILYCLFLIYLIVNAFLSYSANTSLEYSLIFIASFFLFFVEWSKKNLKTFFIFGRIVCVIFACTILLAVVAPNIIILISQYFNPGRSEVIASEISVGQYSGLVGEKALAAYAMVFGANIEIAYYYIQNKKLDFKNYGFIFLYFVCTFLTGKRMLAVILLAQIAVALLLFEIKNKGAKVFIGCFVAMIIVIIVLLAIPQVNIVIARFIAGEDDDTFNGRTLFWDCCIEMFNEKPIFGYGFGTFNDVFAEKVEYVFHDTLWNMHAHNMYLQMLGECGIVGFLIFILILLVFLILSIKLFKSSCLPDFWKGVLWFSIGSQILFIIYGITGNCLYDVQQIFAHLLSLSIYFTVNRINKRYSVSVDKQTELLHKKELKAYV